MVKLKFLIICSLFLLAIVIVIIANGAEVELTRTLPITDTINEDARKAGEEMWTEFQQAGCLRAVLFGIVKSEKPHELELTLLCVEWNKNSPYAKPARE